ncbi:hypothetical protein HK101_005993, partial [Irineochytrium annulatum]
MPDGISEETSRKESDGVAGTADGLGGKAGAAKLAALRRAALCCLHLLIRHPAADITLSASAIKEGRATAGSLPAAVTHADTANSTQAAHHLRLQMAVTSGELDRVVIGDPLDLLAHYVAGPCVVQLGPLIARTPVGELGFAPGSWAYLRGELGEGVDPVVVGSAMAKDLFGQ